MDFVRIFSLERGFDTLAALVLRPVTVFGRVPLPEPHCPGSYPGTRAGGTLPETGTDIAAGEALPSVAGHPFHQSSQVRPRGATRNVLGAQRRMSWSSCPSSARPTAATADRADSLNSPLPGSSKAFRTGVSRTKGGVGMRLRAWGGLRPPFIPIAGFIFVPKDQPYQTAEGSAALSRCCSDTSSKVLIGGRRSMRCRMDAVKGQVLVLRSRPWSRSRGRTGAARGCSRETNVVVLASFRRSHGVSNPMGWDTIRLQASASPHPTSETSPGFGPTAALRPTLGSTASGFWILARTRFLRRSCRRHREANCPTNPTGCLPGRVAYGLAPNWL
jgi:hypothetical protein